eukprot:4662122-Amphidinium_carterae.1
MHSFARVFNECLKWPRCAFAGRTAVSIAECHSCGEHGSSSPSHNTNLIELLDPRTFSQERQLLLR